jgi:hypothetical protein
VTRAASRLEGQRLPYEGESALQQHEREQHREERERNGSQRALGTPLQQEKQRNLRYAQQNRHTRDGQQQPRPDDGIAEITQPTKPSVRVKDKGRRRGHEQEKRQRESLAMHEH